MVPTPTALRPEGPRSVSAGQGTRGTRTPTACSTPAQESHADRMLSARTTGGRPSASVPPHTSETPTCPAEPTLAAAEMLVDLTPIVHEAAKELCATAEPDTSVVPTADLDVGLTPVLMEFVELELNVKTSEDVRSVNVYLDSRGTRTLDASKESVMRILTVDLLEPAKITSVLTPVRSAAGPARTALCRTTSPSAAAQGARPGTHSGTAGGSQGQRSALLAVRTQTVR